MDGAQIRSLREYHRLTQGEVARAAGLHQSDVSDVERGVRGARELRLRVVGGISRATRPSRALDMFGDRMRTYLINEGLSNVRVFGSAARREERWDSDIDILADVPAGTTLFDLDRWENRLRQITGGIKVDLIPDDQSRSGKPFFAKTTGEAVPL